MTKLNRLTSFVIKVFCAAQAFDGIKIDEHLMCDSVSWLVENQRQDGAFPEVKNIIHTSMMVGESHLSNSNTPRV